MTRIVILAAGRETPFGDTGHCKHLLTINGEPILDRQIRQWRARGVTDIHIAGPHKVAGCTTFDPATEPDDVDISSSVKAWNPAGRTIITYGDCVYTDQACDDIIDIDWPRFLHYCRPRDGRRPAEGFAMSFHPEQHEALLWNITRTPHLVAAGVTWRADGWVVSRLMDGVPLDQLGRHHTNLDCYIPIDDATDDIDTPAEYETIKAAFA